MSSKTEKGKAPSAAGESPAVDPNIWKALAAPSPALPPAGSAVYYFPHGHAEQYCPSPPPNYPPSFFPCHLSALNLHADPTTDQLFATFTLTSHSPISPPPNPATISIASVAKTLSESEVSRRKSDGCCCCLRLPESGREVFGCSVGDVDVYDLNDRRWRMRHVVGGGRRPQHLLTDGWRCFVLSKMLVAGDAVVFARDGDGVIFVGCRRCDADDDQFHGTENSAESSSRLITKLMKKREDAETVKEVIRWAEEDVEGIVEGRYYPDSKLPVYVVKKELVENAMRVQWKRGMRVAKMLEKGDGLIYCILGTIRSLSPESTNTPWRMLEVIWDEICKKTFENPWEVKPVPIITPMLEKEIQNLLTDN